METALEFGTGSSTEYFLKNTDRLVSLELMTAGKVQQTKQKLKEYRDKFHLLYPNWSHVCIRCTDFLSELSERDPSGIEMAALPYAYEDEISSICDYGYELCRGECDLVYAHSSIFGHADIVNTLFRSNIPFIAATILEGWDRILTPDAYTVVECKSENALSLSLWILGH